MDLINIKVVNACVGLTDAAAISVVSAIQTQISRDFAPVWGIDAHLNYMGSVLKYDSLNWFVILLNNADQANALGYHELTPQGLPLGKIFVTTTQQDGMQWSVTFSHEVLEMLVDPYINSSIFVQYSNTAGRIFMYEVCDPVEDDSLGYTINGVLVSDFVFPEYFEPGTPSGTQLDFMKHINTPLMLPASNLGYQAYFDVTSGSGWDTTTAGKIDEPRSADRIQKWTKGGKHHVPHA